MARGSRVLTQHEALLAALRADFLPFLRFAFGVVSPHDTYLYSWHLGTIAHHLGQVAAGASRRLVINMPPRSLKSISVSVAWVAYLLGRDPSLRIIVVSYSQELAAKLHRDCRLVMEHPLYQQAFPDTRLRRATDTEIETTAGGGRFATSVGGVLTGRGADLIIIDDPIKPDDAHSESARKAVNTWYGSTLASRLNNQETGRIVIVMQRLHQDDLSGHVLRDGGFDHLKLPAIAERDDVYPLPRGLFHERAAGEVLQPSRESLERLEGLRAVMGSYNFSAQYQQEPVPAEGGLFKRKWPRTYDKLPERGSSQYLVQSWDTAIKSGRSNDFSACVTALVQRNEVYIVDVYRDRLEFPDLQRQVIARAERFKPAVLLIEDAASGTQLIQQLNALSPRGVPRPTACKPEKDKYSRAAGVSPQIEAGGLLLPREAPWLADFMIEFLAFPGATYDDQVDALVQLLAWARERSDEHISIDPACFDSLRSRSYWDMSGERYAEVYNPNDDDGLLWL
jgi:predicted phage terminase large subunit-like protein